MLFDNINYLLRQRGAMPLSADAFLGLDPDALWDLVSQLPVPFEVLNTVRLQDREALLKAVDLKLVVLDVDGVFTDGGMYYTSTGEEIKKFNVKDGMAITRARKQGVDVGIISAASRSEVVGERARILGIERVYVGKQPKEEVLEEWLYTLGFGFDQVAYLGDDINDVVLLEKCGLTAAPADAMPEAKAAAKWVLNKRGGEGCIREFFDLFVV